MNASKHLFAALLLAPVYCIAAGSGDGLAQLQSWSPVARDVSELSMPKAAQAYTADDGSRLKAGPVSAVCCANSAACSKVKNEGLAALEVKKDNLPYYDSSLAAFKAITASRWYMSFPDGKALTDGSIGSFFITRKSLVGSYRFDIKAMSVVVAWNPDPLLGFSVSGESKFALSRICFTPGRIEIVSMGQILAVVAEPRSVTVQPSPNTGTDQPVRREGYLLFSAYGQYLVSSDGK